MDEQRKKKKKIIVMNNNSKYGDGVSWYRGEMLGKGSFGSVYLATLKNPRSKYSCLPPVMAVKSAEVSFSGSIQKEKEVFNSVKGCGSIIRCYGDETTLGLNGTMVFNLLLEYGSGGTLADHINNNYSNGRRRGLPEFEVRCFTKSLLLGLKHIHGIGFVHCDMKPENILLVPNSNSNSNSQFRAKICDLGLAKREQQSKKRKLKAYWRGTPRYMSPETVIDNVQDRPSDIWALGCIVLEMLTGEPPWGSSEDLTPECILKQISQGNEVPKIPPECSISKEARDFLKGCFVRNPMYRLTAEMLLNHSFVQGIVVEVETNGNDDGIEGVRDIQDINLIESVSFVTDSDEDDDDDDDDWSYYDSENESSYDDDYWSEDEGIEDQHQDHNLEIPKTNTGIIGSTILGAA